MKSVIELFMCKVKENINDYYWRKAFDQVFSRTHDGNKEIIMHVFGCLDGEKKTNEQISKLYGLTPERVRQIRARAIRSIEYGTAFGKMIKFLEMKGIGIRMVVEEFTINT